MNYGAAIMMAAGDLDGDGKLDLILVEQSTPAVLCFPGHGDGTFASPATLALPYAPAYAALVDLNGDGRFDLVAVATSTPRSGYGALMTAFGNGDGTFRTPRSMAVADGPFSVFTGDFNWDGKQDLVLETGYGTASFYAGNGDGTFGVPEAILVREINHAARL